MDVHRVVFAEHRHARHQVAAHMQLSRLAVAPQQAIDPQRALHMQLQPFHHGVLQLRVTQHGEVAAAVGVATAQCSVDLQIAFDEHQVQVPGWRPRQAGGGLGQGAQCAAGLQGRVQVQRGQLQVTADPGDGGIGQGVGLRLQLLGHRAVGGEQMGHVGQGYETQVGHRQDGLGARGSL